MTLYKNINNATLLSLFRAAWNVHEEYSSFINDCMIEDTINHHECIIDALIQRDYHKFEESMSMHFYSSKIFNCEIEYP